MQKLNEILAEALMVDISEIEDTMEFRSHPSWDSLAMLTVIASISDEFQVNITDKDVKSFATVAELAKFVEEKRK